MEFWLIAYKELRKIFKFLLDHEYEVVLMALAGVNTFSCNLVSHHCSTVGSSASYKHLMNKRNVLNILFIIHRDVK